jgi:putative thioredoxin
MFSPILEKAVAEAEGAWELIKVNTEEHPDLSTRYGIRSLPTLKLFLDGEEIAESLGVLAEPQLKRWISRHLPSPFAEDLEAAEKALLDDDPSAALEKIETILAAEPENDTALFLKIRATFATHPADVAALARAFPADSEYAARANGLRDLATLLTHLPETEASELTDTLANGYNALRRLDFAPACEAFLHVLEKHRHFGDDAAAKALKQVFLYLGPRHEVSETYQRKFASLLFS